MSRNSYIFLKCISSDFFFVLSSFYDVSDEFPCQLEKRRRQPDNTTEPPSNFYFFSFLKLDVLRIGTALALGGSVHFCEVKTGGYGSPQVSHGFVAPFLGLPQLESQSYSDYAPSLLYQSIFWRDHGAVIGVRLGLVSCVSV